MCICRKRRSPGAPRWQWRLRSLSDFRTIAPSAHGDTVWDIVEAAGSKKTGSSEARTGPEAHARGLAVVRVMAAILPRSPQVNTERLFEVTKYDRGVAVLVLRKHVRSKREALLSQSCEVPLHRFDPL